MKVRVWVNSIKTIDNYIEEIDDIELKFRERQLISEIITPNKRYFRKAGYH